MTDAIDALLAPHHDPSERWVSNPRPEPGETVTVTVEVPAAAGIDRMFLRSMHDGEATFAEGARSVANASEDGLDVARWTFDLECHNAVVDYRFWCGGAHGARWLTAAGLVDHDPLDHHDFRLLTTGGTPSWVPETVWYQIFPDRFATTGRYLDELPEWAERSGWDDPVADGRAAMRQMYGGDLDAIAARLDHLVDLGVGGIYLTPVFPGRSNHRYDAATFDRVDPVLGGDEALVGLRRACDRAGLRLITDLTLNHTGDHHDWFVAARADATADEVGYYYFTEHPERYESWLGVPSLPKLDHSSAGLRARLYDGPESVLGRFLRAPYRLDGWRIDVANMTGRHGLVDLNASVRSTSRRTSDAIDRERWLVGEHFFDATSDVQGDGWHGVMNYSGVARPLASWLGRPDALGRMFPGPGQDPRAGVQVARAMDDVRASWPWQSQLGSLALLASHDTARWRSIARSDDLARVGVGLLLTLPGAPCWFYGDEIGMRGDDNHTARSPMIWDESRWDRTMHAWYRSLGRLRAGSSALAHGGFRWVERSDDALAFLRESRDERVLVRATRGAAPSLAVPWDRLRARQAELIGGDADWAAGDAGLRFASDGASFGVWSLDG